MTATRKLPVVDVARAVVLFADLFDDQRSNFCGTVKAEVSSNVVGYKTENKTTGKLNMHTVQFNQVGKDGFNLNEDLSIPNAAGGSDILTADLMQIWNPATSGYQIFYLYDDGEESGWCDFLSDEYFEDVCDPIQPGVAWWYSAQPNTRNLRSPSRRRSNQSLELSGKVLALVSLFLEKRRISAMRRFSPWEKLTLQP